MRITPDWISPTLTRIIVVSWLDDWDQNQSCLQESMQEDFSIDVWKGSAEPYLEIWQI